MSKIALFMLCLFVAFLPFEMMAAFGELPSGAKLLGMVVVGTALAAFIAGHPVRLIPLALVLRIALVAWAVFSLGWSYAPDDSLAAIPRHLQLLVFVLIVWEFAVTYRDHLWLLRAYLFGMFMPLLMVYADRWGLYHIREASEEVGRSSGGGQDANYLAAMLAITMVLAVYLATNPQRFDRRVAPLYWLMVALAVPAILLTGSRSGFICLLAAVPCAMLVGGVSLRRALRLMGYGAAALAAVVIARYVVPALLWERSTDLTTQVHTFESRYAYWERGMVYGFLPHPLAGIGVGAFSAGVTQMSGVWTGSAHNLVIYLLVELGVVGTVIFTVFIALVVRAAFQLPWREKALWLGILCIWFIMSMAVGSQTGKLDWLIQVLVLCQAAAFRRSAVKGRSPRVAPLSGLAPGRPPRPSFGKP